MEPSLPFWFKQRQCKLEAAGDNTYKVTAPNLAECYLRVFNVDGSWKAALRSSADGPDNQVAAAALPHAKDAWDAAFELFRNRVVV